MNKKSYLSRVRLPRTPAEWLEAVMNFIFFLCGMLAVGCVVLISVYMVISGVPAIHKIGLFQFLFGTKWASTAAQPLFGILPFILSSIYGTLGAAIIGVPIGLLTAVFLSKAADPKLRTVVVTAIELLSGIPSVVFGLLGMQVLVPAVAKTFGKASGACLLSAIVVLSIMILPSIVSVSVTALNDVLREHYPNHKVFSDIGCYTLGSLPPFRAIDTCVEMGASVTMAKGAADGGQFPSVAVIGDSTFTHSGMTALLDAVNEKSNITVVISDNLTTGMTGGQDSAGTGRLEQICAGLGVEPEHIRVVVPLPKNMEEIRRTIREEIEYKGVSVIIPRRECIQTAKRHNAKKQ